MSRLDILGEMNTILGQIERTLYENRRHFAKLNTKGEILSDQAQEWAAILDDKTGLVWEYKSTTGKHERNRQFVWSANHQEIEGHIQETNEENLAGCQDWRLPNLEELQILVASGLDRRYFGPMVGADGFTSLFVAQQEPSEIGQALDWEEEIVLFVEKAHVMLCSGHKS
ncbi:hypothetical protein CCP3SC1AL1_480001 [Gammaproteobacteria bacterium]